MQIQVLVATMNQSDHSLIEKMNIQSDALIGNQCNRDSVEHFVWNDYNISYYNFAERGVGLNRNNTLMRASGDICLFADDDMIYVNGYPTIVENAFHDYPDADVIIFNLIEQPPRRFVISTPTRINYLNYLRYGTARMAVKLSSIKNNGIYFNQCFGGGTEHSHGEDNIFLTSCLKHGLKIYAIPEYIATLTETRISTWNNGYSLKYLKDQGFLYKAISKRWWKLLCLQDALRHHKLYNRPWYEVFRIMISL